MVPKHLLAVEMFPNLTGSSRGSALLITLAAKSYLVTKLVEEWKDDGGTLLSDIVWFTDISKKKEGDRC